jgi:lysophospholipase L1-like esterase
MTALAVGASVTISVRDGGTVAIATNGGTGSAAISLAEGGTSSVSFGPAPERRVLGPFKEGSTVILSNSNCGSFDYDVETTVDPASFGPTGAVRFVAIGDSITDRSNSTATFLTPNACGLSWFDLAMLYLDGKGIWTRNSANAGETSAEMAARFSTDVLAYNPDVVTILSGQNDATLADCVRDVESMIVAAKAVNKQPILLASIPGGSAGITPPTGATATGAITGGTLAAGTYYYRVATTWGSSSISDACAEFSTTVASGTTGSVAVKWDSSKSGTGYKIYRGSTPGTEQLIATITAAQPARPACSFTDTGSVTPSGALPTDNTGLATNPTRGNRSFMAMQTLAQKYNLPFIDLLTPLADLTGTGRYIAGSSYDGTHPSPWGSNLLAQAAAAQLSPFLKPRKHYLSINNTDSDVRYTNPLFLNTSGNLPTSWTVTTAGSGTAETIVQDTAFARGNILKLTRTDGTTRAVASPAISGFAVGDKIAASFRVRVTNADLGGGEGSVKIAYTGAAGGAALCTLRLQSDTVGAYGGGVTAYFEGVIPAGTTSVQVTLQCQYAPVTIELAQLTIRNLTTLGVVYP